MPEGRRINLKRLQRFRARAYSSDFRLLCALSTEQTIRKCHRYYVRIDLLDLAVFKTLRADMRGI